MAEQPKNYSWNAEDYAKHSSSQYEWAKELIPKLKLSGNETLLDIGCGDGKVTTALATCLPRGCVVGIDNSEDMINLARHTFPQGAYPNLSFQKMDARALTFQEKFDRVFSNAALHWIIDQQSVLHGVQRSLKNGGRLLFQMGGKGNAQDILSVLNELLRANPWKKFFSDFSFPYGFYAPEEYETWLFEARLKPERAELLPKDMQLLGKEGLLDRSEQRGYLTQRDFQPNLETRL
jgi:trans-aconitate methyltransferase